MNVADNHVVVETSADNGTTWTQLLDFQEPGHDGTTTAYLRRRAKFATDGSTFTGWTNIDSVGAGPFRGTSVTINYYPDGSKALLTTRVYQNTHTMLSDFERCPWASEVNGVNTEECRTVRHEGEDYETRLAELNLETGARRPLMTLPGFAVASAGVSEAGDEMMLVRQRGRSSYERVPSTDDIPGYTFINTQVSHDQCQASWHSLKDPSATPFQIMAPSMCTSVSSDGGGTIAPVRMKVPASRPR